MKEINAIVRMNKIQKIKAALVEAGYHSISIHQVTGRGKQRGLLYDFSKYVEEDDEAAKAPSQFLAKRMIVLVVEDKCAEKVIEIIMEAGRTGEVGDGKIFVMPVGDVVRIRTAETGDAALL